MRDNLQAMNNLWDDKLREECGVFGIYGHSEASRMTYLGLYALQHRGQESCGIAVSNGRQIVSEREMGYVSEAFDQTRLIECREPARSATFVIQLPEKFRLRECQPFLVTCQHGQIAVCHNGNLPFAREERRKLESEARSFPRPQTLKLFFTASARSHAAGVAEAIPEVLRHTKALSRCSF